MTLEQLFDILLQMPGLWWLFVNCGSRKYRFQIVTMKFNADRLWLGCGDGHSCDLPPGADPADAVWIECGFPARGFELHLPDWHVRYNNGTFDLYLLGPERSKHLIANLVPEQEERHGAAA